jgi:hypothetical protein
MAKQSLKDPKFRCNACKEFYFADENPVHYQCPKHGYLCEKHIIDTDFSFTARESINRKEIHLPPEFIGCCHLYKDSTRGESVKSVYIPRENLKNAVTDEQFIEHFQKYIACAKKALKFNWNTDLKMWVEEGKEVIEKPAAKSEKSNKSGEIKLLIDLFEKDILTKEQFLNQLKSSI